MRDKLCRWLIAIASMVLATVLAVFVFRDAAHKQARQNAQTPKPLVLVQKARLASEDARWFLAPDVPPPIGPREQRRDQAMIVGLP